MDSKSFVELINKASGSKTKTKNIIMSCYKDIVLNKFLTIEQISNDLKKFLKWLENSKNVEKYKIIKIIAEIKNINIDKNTSVDNIRDSIDNIFEKNLGEMNINYRMEYNVLKILQWIKNTQGINVTPIKEKLENYNYDGDIEDIFDEINDIFKTHISNDYDFYEKIFQKLEQKRVNFKIRQISLPKFKIVEKQYNNNNNNNNIVRRNVDLVGGKGGDKLRNVDKMVQGGLENTIKNDYANLELIASEFADENGVFKLKDVWKDNIYKFVQENKLKPRTNKRISLQIFTAYLVLNQSFDDILESSESIISPLDYDSSFVNKMINKMIEKGYMVRYKTKFKNYLSPKLDLTTVVNFLKSNNVDTKSINNVISEIYEKIGNNLRESNRNEVVYSILKNNNIKDGNKKIAITRKIINNLFN
jgi:hypothetical protein